MKSTNVTYFYQNYIVKIAEIQEKMNKKKKKIRTNVK